MNTINTKLYEKISRLQWLLHKHQMRGYAQGGPMADPTRGQGRILAILKMQDGISTKDLSYLLGIRVSSLNELLAKLEKAGYVTREPAEADKRVMLVKLTEKGTSEQQREWTPGDIFSCLSAEEQSTFGGYLDRVIASLEEGFADEENDDERTWWMQGARERMGDEMFERLFSTMHGGHAPHGFDPRAGFMRGRGFGGLAPDGRADGRGTPPEAPDAPEHK